MLEHIVHPDHALREICRVLKAGGAHIFTMPYHPNMKSELRVIERDGKLHFLKEPVYHGNPVDNKGSLVIYDWGWDFADYCYKKTGMTTTILFTHDSYMGIEAEFIEVFISRKVI